MTDIFKKQKTPQEDPAIAEERRREQQRAEDDRTKATQDQLRAETTLRSRKSGTRSLLGSLLGKSSLLGSG